MMNPMKTSMHYKRVREFMIKAQQKVRDTPEILTEEERLLRAKLIFEECMETINLGLGVDIGTMYNDPDEGPTYVEYSPHNQFIEFSIERPMDLIETIDGCADIKVVTTGTLVAMGVPDAPIQLEVDNNNLAKFGPGGYRDESGKWIKPPNHQPPNLQGVLDSLKGQTMSE